MKNLKMILAMLFLAITTSSEQSLLATHEVQSAQEAIERVDTKMSLFDQIIAQAAIIVKSSDQTARVRAKKELTRLINHSALSGDIKDLIKNDIATIKTAKTQDKLDEAYQRLLDTYKQINTQANGIERLNQEIDNISKL